MKYKEWQKEIQNLENDIRKTRLTIKELFHGISLTEMSFNEEMHSKIRRIKKEYNKERKAIWPEKRKPDAAVKQKLLVLAEQYRSKLAALKHEYWKDTLTRKEVAKEFQTLASRKKYAKGILRCLRYSKYRYSHIKVALGLYRGVPINSLITESERKKLSMDFVFSIIDDINASEN